MNKYEKIINLNHNISKKHPRMSITKRSAQFSPFAALIGYGDAIKEEARVVSNYKYLNNDQKLDISNIINILLDNKLKYKIKIKYFIPDKLKEGINIIEKIGVFKKINLEHREIILDDKTKIFIDNILELKIIN